MKHVPQERLLRAAEPRHARLFELIRQGNLLQRSKESNTAPALEIDATWCRMACKSLRRAA